MDTALKLLAASGDNISSLGLLLVLVLAFLKGWIVPGPLHRECLRDRDGYKAHAESAAKADEQELTQLRREIEELRSDYHARRGRVR